MNISFFYAFTHYNTHSLINLIFLEVLGVYYGKLFFANLNLIFHIIISPNCLSGTQDFVHLTTYQF